MKRIPEFEQLYAVTSDGRVYSFRSKKFLSPRSNPQGYLFVALCDRGRRQDRAIHRLVAEAFIPNPLHLPEVNHLDFNKANNTRANLEWSSSQDNSRHAEKSGRRPHPRGSNHYRARLTEADVRHIRELAERSISQERLAEIYGVSRSAIYFVVSRRSWAHLH